LHLITSLVFISVATATLQKTALYSNAKVVALICNNQLFVKKTNAGKIFIKNPVEAPAYPGAKPSFLIENIEDSKWLSELIRLTEAELPLPKTKKKKK